MDKGDHNILATKATKKIYTAVKKEFSIQLNYLEMLMGKKTKGKNPGPSKFPLYGKGPGFRHYNQM